MSKITNNGLTRSGTARMLCCTHMATVRVKGLGRHLKAHYFRSAIAFLAQRHDSVRSWRFTKHLLIVTYLLTYSSGTVLIACFSTRSTYVHSTLPYYVVCMCVCLPVCRPVASYGAGWARAPPTNGLCPPTNRRPPCPTRNHWKHWQCSGQREAAACTL